MKTFLERGCVNTDETCAIGIQYAQERGLAIVTATTEGGAGKSLCEMAEKMDFAGKIVAVTHAYGSRAPGQNALLPENRAYMAERGVAFVTAAHVLSGVERGLSSKMSGVYPAEIMAHTLRMFSQGVKVAVEIGCMALDAGVIQYGAPVVCLGERGRASIQPSC